MVARGGFARVGKPPENEPAMAGRLPALWGFDADVGLPPPATGRATEASGVLAGGGSAGRRPASRSGERVTPDRGRARPPLGWYAGARARGDRCACGAGTRGRRDRRGGRASADAAALRGRADGGPRGSLPGSKRSTMTMRPPQQGHGGRGSGALTGVAPRVRFGEASGRRRAGGHVGNEPAVAASRLGPPAPATIPSGPCRDVPGDRRASQGSAARWRGPRGARCAGPVRSGDTAPGWWARPWPDLVVTTPRKRGWVRVGPTWTPTAGMGFRLA